MAKPLCIYKPQSQQQPYSIFVFNLPKKQLTLVVLINTNK